MALVLTVVSPLPDYLSEVGPAGSLATRPASLDGKVIGLLPNFRPAAVNILKAIGALLSERFQLKAVHIEDPVPEATRQGKLLDDMLKKLDDLARCVDLVIVATAD